MTAYTQSTPVSANSEYTAYEFFVRQIMSEQNTATLVKVMAVTTSGGVSPIGTVDVLPLVNQIDGQGNATPHATVHGLPYCRVQGGANAVILDPIVGDIGCAVFAPRDISSVKAKVGQANPGSFRRFDMADGIYLFAVMGGTPTQYVQFSSGGINVVSPTQITFQAPTITLNGNTVTTGTLANNGKNVGSTHAHGGVQTGGGNTGVPV